MILVWFAVINNFPLPLLLTLTATKKGPKRSTPALRVTGLPLFQEDKSWLSAIPCQLLPVLLWGHLFLLLATECLINPVHLPHLLQCLLTVSPHLLAGICCPYWSPGQQCLQQMFYPWCPEWGNLPPFSITSASLPLLFLLSSSYLVSLQESVLEITSTKNTTLMFSDRMRCPSSDILWVLLILLYVVPPSRPHTQ